jgi:hypothetical protein
MKKRRSTQHATVVLAALVVGSVAARAQDRPLLDDPELLRELARFEAWSTTAGETLPLDALTCAFVRAAIVDHAVLAADGSPELLLVSFQTNFAGYKLFPNIVHRAPGGAWVRTVIPQKQDGFRHVAGSGDGRFRLVLMDNIPESAGWETRTVLSNDGGRSWHYGESLRKYVYFDTIRYLKMSGGGKVTAIEHYQGDVGGYDQVGYYVFESTDWGETWSERRYEPVLDTAELVDGYPTIQRMRESGLPLRGFELPGLDACAAEG